MHCIEPGLWRALRVAWWAVGVGLGLTACAQRSAQAPAPTRPASATPVLAPTPAPRPAPAAAPRAEAAGPAATPAGPATRPPLRAPAAEVAPARAPEADRGPLPRNPRYVRLDPPPAPRSEAELRLQLAQRLVAAHPDSSYTTRAPDRLLAIPVLEVELNADGSVKAIKVLRKPSTGNEATALAMAAVRRAAPYGNVSRLPKPWKVVETFLFDDHLRFKPRTLDLN